jgi:hypothetical protein
MASRKLSLGKLTAHTLTAPKGFLALIARCVQNEGSICPLSWTYPVIFGEGITSLMHEPTGLMNTRHLISVFRSLDGNYKLNLFFKRDDGSDKAITDSVMYFPTQAEFDEIAQTYVVPDEDKVT